MRRNTRIAVSLDPGTREVVGRLARARGMAKSTLLAQLIGEMRPQLVQLAEVFERVKQDPAGALRQLNAAAEDAKAHLGEAQRAHRFRVEDLSTGEPWKPGLTWTDEAADRALAQARKAAPDREWILREVGTDRA